MPLDFGPILFTEGTHNANASITRIEPSALTAPMGLWFDATGLTGFSGLSTPPANSNYDPEFSEITFIWTVNSQPLAPYSAPQNMVTGWNNANVAYGKKVALHFPAAGAYTVDLFAVGPNGDTAVASTTFTIVSQDGEYPATQTVCFSNDGGETWADEKTGCQRATTFAELQTAVNNATGPLRILFKRGQEVTRGEVSRILANGASEWLNHFGTWSTGAKPIINCQKDDGSGTGNHVIQIAGPANPITQFTCENIDFRGGWDAATETGIPGYKPFHFIDQVNDTHFVISQCDFAGLDALWIGVGDQTSSMIVADCTATDWLDYGAFAEPSASSSVAIIGTRFMQNVDAGNGSPTTVGKEEILNQHGPWRYSLLDHCYLACNDFFSRTGWSNLAPDTADQPCARMSQDGVGNVSSIIDRCVMEGGFHVVAYSGQNGSTSENPGNHLIDRSLLISTAKTAEDFILNEYGGFTLRNTLMATLNVPDYHGNAWLGAVQLKADSPGTGNVGAPMRLYGNTVVNMRDGTNDPGDPWPVFTNSAGFTNITEENNVLHAPSIDTPVDPSTPISTAATVPGVTPRYKGVQFYPDDWLINNTFPSAVADAGSFTVAYPGATDQTYWQARIGSDNLDTLRDKTANVIYYAEESEMTIAFEASVIRITNNSGTTWPSGNSYALKLDFKSSRPAIPTTYANPATVPLPTPSVGSSARNPGAGLFPYGDFSTPGTQAAGRGSSPDAGSIQVSGVPGGAGSPADYFSGNFTEGWWRLDDPSTMFQTRGAETGAVTDGDPVGTVTSEGGTPYLTNNADNQRPTFIAAEGALDFDENNNRLYVDAPSRGSDMYVAYVMKTTDIQMALLGSANNTVYAGLCNNNDSSTAVSAFSGTPTFKVNGVEQVAPTRDSLRDAIATDAKVLVEIVGVDLTAAQWLQIYFSSRASSSLYLGLIWDIYLAENTADVRANVPGLIAARNGITLP